MTTQKPQWKKLGGLICVRKKGSPDGDYFRVDFKKTEAKVDRLVKKYKEEGYCIKLETHGGITQIFGRKK
jgi:hypothetical protein